MINGASDLKLWNGSGGAGGKSGLFESALRYATASGLFEAAEEGPRGGARYQLKADTAE
ncbi:hypothetical protein [Streptomyces roseofulvus]|uniref:hypothetical protein n=1 Tax=Streptomyces roseofulvus TaxID=33902 RepID=UPI0031FC4984